MNLCPFMTSQRSSFPKMISTGSYVVSYVVLWNSRLVYWLVDAATICCQQKPVPHILIQNCVHVVTKPRTCVVVWVRQVRRTPKLAHSKNSASKNHFNAYISLSLFQTFTGHDASDTTPSALALTHTLSHTIYSPRFTPYTLALVLWQ